MTTHAHINECHILGFSSVSCHRGFFLFAFCDRRKVLETLIMNETGNKIYNRKCHRNLHKVKDMFDISNLRKEDSELVTLGDSSWDVMI